MAIDFPAPVAPATKRCGIFARSAKIASPDTSRPSAKVSGKAFLKSSKPKRLRKPTKAIERFGTSMPTADFPGIGASILKGCAAKAKAKSFCSAVILESFTPSAGLKVYCVTEGPTFTSVISTSIPKFCNVRLMMFAFALMSPEEGVPRSPSNKSRGGRRYLARRLIFAGAGEINSSGAAFSTAVFSSALAGGRTAATGRLIWGESAGSSGFFSSRLVPNLKGASSIIKIPTKAEAESKTKEAKNTKSFKNAKLAKNPSQPPERSPKAKSAIPSAESRNKIPPIKVASTKCFRREKKKEKPARKNTSGTKKKDFPNKSSKPRWRPAPTSPAFPKAASVKSKASAKETIAKTDCLVSGFNPSCHLLLSSLLFLFLFLATAYP